MSAKDSKYDRYKVSGRREKNKQRNIARDARRKLAAQEKKAWPKAKV